MIIITNPIGHRAQDNQKLDSQTLKNGTRHNAVPSEAKDKINSIPNLMKSVDGSSNTRKEYLRYDDEAETITFYPNALIKSEL
jgi:hypothetical protein